MRILFTSVSAHGHLLPLVPLMSAALDEGHRVALVASEGLASTVHDELPTGVEFLPAGPMPFELATEAARRTGGDVMHPTVEGIGETFGGVLLDLSQEAALPAAREWRPDVVVSQMFNTLGGLLAATLDVPWHRVKISVALPAPWVAAITAAADRRYAALGLTPTGPTTTLDLWPASLGGGTADAYPDVPTRAVRTHAHRRAGSAAPQPRPADDGPRILVTLGTIFSDADVLGTVVDQALAAAPDAHVVATLGMLLGAGDTATPAWADDERVECVPFAPIDELLDGVSAVVSVGGAGTTLASLSRGVPMVVWPQGADQPAIAAQVAVAGAGLVVDDVQQVGEAVRELLDNQAFADAAEGIAREIERADDPHTVIREVVAAL